MICGEKSLVNRHATGKVAISMRCRAWTCTVCRRKRKAELIAEAVAGRPNRLVTITVRPDIGPSPAWRAAKLANAWRLVCKRAARSKSIGKIEYLAVFERTKRGEPHLHILCRSGYIPQRWLSQQMKELIGAPIVDVRKVDSARNVAGYVAKYIGKDPYRFATCKRYWKTKNWVNGASSPEEREAWTTGRWEMVDATVADLWKQWGGWCNLAWCDGEAAWTGGPEPPWEAGKVKRAPAPAAS